MKSVISPPAEANGSLCKGGGGGAGDMDLDEKPTPSENVVNVSCLSECPSFDSTPCASPRKGDAKHLAPGLLTQSTAAPETANVFTHPVVRLVGAPLAAGQPLEGVQRGPQALRDAGLKECVRCLNWQFEDHGDVSITPCGAGEASAPAAGGLSPPQNYQQLYYSRKKIKNCSYVGKACGQIFEACREGALQRRFVLNVGGDHSIATGTISAMLSVYPNLAVVWVDAHGDCNTPETSPSANYHGMPVAHLLGWFTKKAKGFGWREKKPMASPNGSSANGDMDKQEAAAVGNGVSTYYRLHEENLVFIGLRDIDPDEARLLTNSRVKAFTMTDLDRLGIGQVMERALESIDPDGDRPLYLSFDIDSCDPGIAPGTGTKARGGLTYREAHYIAEVLAQTRRLVGMDLVEINPAIDKELQWRERSGGGGVRGAHVHDEESTVAGGGGHHEEEMHGDQLPLVKGTTPTVRLGIELAASALGKTIL